MKIDSHVHTVRCGHAQGTPSEYLAAAERQAIDVLVFTEHVPLPDDLDPHRQYSMSPAEWPEYVREVRSLRSDTVEVLLGAEADWLPGRMEHVTSLLEGVEWDVVLGSVHMIDGWAFDDPDLLSTWEGRDVDEVWRRYFGLFSDAVRSGLFDVMAHPDLVKKFRHMPAFDLAPLYAEVADLLAAHDTAIEVSTAGLRKPCEELYPGDVFLSACRAQNILVTTSSDAHAPEEVGADLDLAVDAVRRAGYDSIVYHEKRRPVVVRI